MRVLLVYVRYRERGGEDAVVDQQIALLTARGHDFVALEASNADLGPARGIGALRTAAEVVWNRSWQQRIATACGNLRPEVIHFHNTFPLMSPAVIRAASRFGAVVMTLHNYRLMCLNAMLYRAGAACQDCVGKALPLPGIVHGCYGSRSASAAVATMIGVHRALGTWSSHVDLFTTPGEFARQLLVRAIEPERIAIVDNFLAQMPDPRRGSGDRFLYVGRLTEEKGIGDLLDTWETVLQDFPLRVVGGGPLEGRVVSASASTGAIDYGGSLDRDEVSAELDRARALIVPSRLYEVQPMVVIEAFAHAVPIIARDGGAVADLVRRFDAGVVYRGGESNELRRAVERLWENPDAASEMGANGRRAFEARFTADVAYGRLLDAYERAIAGSRIRLAPNRTSREGG